MGGNLGRIMVSTKSKPIHIDAEEIQGGSSYVVRDKNETSCRNGKSTVNNRNGHYLNKHHDDTNSNSVVKKTSSPNEDSTSESSDDDGELSQEDNDLIDAILKKTINSQSQARPYLGKVQDISDKETKKNSWTFSSNAMKGKLQESDGVIKRKCLKTSPRMS